MSWSRFLTAWGAITHSHRRRNLPNVLADDEIRIRVRAWYSVMQPTYNAVFPVA